MVSIGQLLTLLWAELGTRYFKSNDVIDADILQKKTTKVTITVPCLKSNDDNDTRFRILVLFRQKIFLAFFSKILRFRYSITFDQKAPCF